MVGALTGCPLPQTAGTPPADPAPTPTPTPTASPDPARDPFEITVREVTLDETGAFRLDVEAPEALVVLPLIAPQNYFLRMDEAPIEGMPTYRTAALRTAGLRPFAPAKARRNAAPALRAQETADGYGEQATFRVGDVTVNAKRAYESPHCLVYVDTRDEAGSAARVAAIASAFETSLRPKVTQLLGPTAGGRADGFNRGDDRTVLLFSRETSDVPASFVPPDLFPPLDDGPSNFGKVLHVNALLSPEAVLPTLAHELGGMTFLMQRLEAYSRMTGEASPVGTDLGYLLDDEAASDYWLYPVMGLLSAQVCGYSAESGNREALLAIGQYLDLPNVFRLDTQALDGVYTSNMGQALLFAAYLYGQNPGFAKALGAQEALGMEAVTLAMGRDFAGVFRDFSLATALDGLAGVPARYSIPFVDLHQTYTLDGKPFPFSGAGAPMAAIVSGNGTMQTIMQKGRAPQGKLRLGISAGHARQATVVLFRPSATSRFIEETP